MPGNFSEKETKGFDNVGFFQRILDRVSQIASLLRNSVFDVLKSVGEVRDKLLNLRETNYNLGLHHFKKGNLRDATFRFKFLHKMWPNYKDEEYYLGYCLALNGRMSEAILILNEFLKENANDERVQSLLNAIRNDDSDFITQQYDNLIHSDV